MSVTVNISSRELQKALRNIAKWSDERKAAVKRAVAETVIAVDKDAKELAPVDTGRLRSSITPRFYKGGLEGSVGSNVEYAVHQEYGPRPGSGYNWRYQPFLNPAAEMNRREWDRKIKQALRETRRVV